MVATAARAVHRPAQEGQSRKYAALDLARKGLWVIPLCWPDEEGHCACGKGHTGHDIGKAPLTPKGVNDSSNSVKTIWEWWDRWPKANIGIDADKSGLVVIAPDSSEAHQRFLKLGLPETAVAQSGGGEGHLHYFYRRTENTPLININKPDDYDIQPRGYMVGAGSLHQSGRLYTWVTNYQWRDVEDLPYAPEWALAEIQQKWDAHTAAPEVDVDFTTVELRPGLVGGTLAEWWNGERCAAHDDGSTDRSLSLFIIGRLLAKQGATVGEIISGLRDRDEGLAFFKYSQRKDGGTKEYTAIARKVLHAVQSESIPADAPPTPPPFEGAGAGRRRFTGHKGAEIRQVRDRLGKIWLEAHRRLGDTDAITRARDCGGLYGRECDNGHVTAPAEKERSTCKQRLHPRCLGTIARKAFYFPKTRGPTTLDGEGDMDINIVQLGRSDVGEDPFEWAPLVRGQLEFIRKHIKKLRDRKGAPQSFRDSYIGWRADLRRGCLTLDLVILGGRDPDLPEWLKESFAEVANETVKVETLHPLDHSAVINDFGNLMSSAVAYTDVEECLAMLEALKNWRLVQPQGKFLGKKAAAKANAEERSLDVSIGGQPQVPIETSSDPASGGGTTHSPCAECGLRTWSSGFRTGRWEKVIGRWSKKLTWTLMADDADPGGGRGEGFEDFLKDVARARDERLAVDVEVF